MEAVNRRAPALRPHDETQRGDAAKPTRERSDRNPSTPREQHLPLRLQLRPRASHENDKAANSTRLLSPDTTQMRAHKPASPKIKHLLATGAVNHAD